MKIASYVKPLPGMNYAEYLKSQMYDIYGGILLTLMITLPISIMAL